MPSSPTDDVPASSATPSPASSAALCLSCGAGRDLALARCEACGHVPETLDDRAAHVLVMELDAGARQALVTHIQGGGRFEPDPVELEEARQAIQAAHPVAVGLFALAVGGPPFLALGCGLFLLAWALLAL